MSSCGTIPLGMGPFAAELPLAEAHGDSDSGEDVEDGAEEEVEDVVHGGERVEPRGVVRARSTSSPPPWEASRRRFHR